MNNKGFSLKSMLFFIIFIVIVIIIFNSVTSSLLNTSTKGTNYQNVYRKYLQTTAIVVPKEDKYSSYNDMELELASGLRKYVESKNIKIEKDKIVYIKLVTLQNSGLIGNLKDITNEAVYCSGYAIGSNEADTYIYKGYIKCGNNYKTEGYNASYDQN